MKTHRNIWRALTWRPLGHDVRFSDSAHPALSPTQSFCFGPRWRLVASVVVLCVVSNLLNIIHLSVSPACSTLPNATGPAEVRHNVPFSRRLVLLCQKCVKCFSVTLKHFVLVHRMILKTIGWFRITFYACIDIVPRVNKMAKVWFFCAEQQRFPDNSTVLNSMNSIIFVLNIFSTEFLCLPIMSFY